MSEAAMVVTFLGTGSAAPSLERNLASVAIQRGGELLLFDCGEAAQIQYRRAGLGFAPLTAIFISHLHGDHVLGLMGLLMSLQLADRQEPLDLYGPEGLAELVEVSKRLFQTGFAYELRIHEVQEPGVLHIHDQYAVSAGWLDHRIPCLGFRLEERSRPGRFDLEAARALGIPPGPQYRELQMGHAVELSDGRTILPAQVLGPERPGLVVTYCTDTRPCAAAEQLALGADLLIYEGTFDAGFHRDARRKGHSTVRDAARIASESRAGALVITHISPRYAGSELLLQQAREVFPNAWIARDLMRVELFHRESMSDSPPGLVVTQLGRRRRTESSNAVTPAETKP